MGSRGVWLRVLTHGNLQSRAISSSICRSSVAQLVTKRTTDSSSPRGPPHLEGCILAQPVDFLVRKYEELLVGRRIDPEAVAPGPERLFQFPGRRDGLARDPQVEVVRKEGFELNAQQPSLGQQGSVLLDEGEEVRHEFRTGDDHRLAEERADLRASDVEDVAQAGDVAERDRIAVGGQPVSEPCAVEVEGNGAAPADTVERLQLLEAVQRAELRGMRYVEHSRGHHVGPGFVAVEGVDVVFDVAGPHLALVAGQHEDLVSRGFDRPGLVDVDVPRIGRQHPFVTPQQSVDDRGVGLGAADQEVHLGLRNPAGLADELPGVFRMGGRSRTPALCSRLVSARRRITSGCAPSM